MPLHQIERLAQRQRPVPVLVVLGEQVLEHLRHEAALHVEDVAV